MTYIALLRGINVGGNRKVEMAKLKQTFERLGFEQVKTFIASGNVVFRDDSKSTAELTEQIEAAIEHDFGFKVDVLLRDIPAIEKIVKSIPEAWINDKIMKCDVMFLWPEIDRPKILKQFLCNPDVEDVIYISGAVVWRINRDNIRPGQTLKFNGANINKQLTIRNPNTVRKLYSLMLVTDKS